MVINPIVGVYIPIVKIPIKGGMTIPNIATFDHGTHGGVIFFSKKFTPNAFRNIYIYMEVEWKSCM